MKGIIGALLIFTIVYIHGAPFDKSEWSSVIKDLQKEYNSRKEESHSWLEKLNNTKHALNSDNLQSFLANVKHRHENNNDKGDNKKRPIPSNLLWLKNKSDSSESDSDDDKSKPILSRKRNDEKNIIQGKHSSRQKSTEEKFDKGGSHDSSESNSHSKNSDEENSKHDLPESWSTWKETDSSDSSSFDKSSDIQPKRDKHHLRDRKRKRDSRQHENYNHYNLWTDSSSDSESGEDEFKQYLWNVLQNKKNRKEIIQMLRNRIIEGQDNLSETEIHYNKLYMLNRDKFMEWKKKMDAKGQLLSGKENLSIEELRNICNISEEMQEDVEEDWIKQCVQNHMSLNDTFHITTDLSEILPSKNKDTTVHIHRDNDTQIIKVSIDVNKPLSNNDTLQIHVENEKTGDPNASTNIRKVTKVITKEGRNIEISSSDNNQPLNNSISNVASNSTPGQAETLEKSENTNTNSGDEQISRNDSNSSSSVQDTVEQENSPVNEEDVSENGEEQTQLNIDSAQETQSSSKHGNTIPDSEPEVRKNVSSNPGPDFPEEGISTSANKETVNQGGNALNNNEISSDDSNKVTDSSITESAVSENEQTPVLILDGSEKSTSSASGSESPSISESVTSEIQHTDVPNSETESSDATEEQTTELSTPVPQSEDSVATEQEEDSGVTDTNLETTRADLNISDSPALKHGQGKLPANQPENSNTEGTSESTESSDIIFVTGEQQVAELTSPQSEITLSDDGNEQTQESKLPEGEHVSGVSESETDSTSERDIEESNTLSNNDKWTDNVDEQTDSSIGDALTSVDAETTSSSSKTEIPDLAEIELTESSDFYEKVNKTTLQTNESSITVQKIDLPSSPTSNSSGTASTVGSQTSELRVNSSSLNENSITVDLDENLESDSTYNTVVSEAVSSITTIEYPSSESPVELSIVTV